MIAALRERVHNVAWVRTNAPGIPDRELMGRPRSEERILLTFDKDFGELAFRAGLPATAGIILLRFPPVSSAHVTRLVVAALDQRADWAGHFSVVERHRIRMRRLPAIGG